jgi:hypothetical protein
MQENNYKKSQTGLIVSGKMSELEFSQYDAGGLTTQQQYSAQRVGNIYQTWGKLSQLKSNFSSLSLHSHTLIEGIPKANLSFHLLLPKTN